MHRKRSMLSLPEEMQTTERLLTKKELAQKGRNPSCPSVPVKIRRSFTNRQSNKKPTALGFNNNVMLSPMYDPKQRLSYLDQVFAKYGCIGEGSFGKVYRVRSREDKKLYAVKRLKANISYKDRYAEIKNNEIVGFNPNCVEFYMAWEESNETFMLLEYCDMSLADYSKLNNDIPEELLWNLLFDICQALNFLHKKNLLHLDVKPGNIMMKKGHYKLGDFGLLVDLQSNNNVHKSTLSDGDSKYLALEVLEGIYTTACDIFGLGLTLLELATDIELPDHGPLWHQLRHKVLPPEFYQRDSLGLIVIVEKMITSEYKKRPSAEKILSYSRLKEIAKKDTKYTRTDFAAPLVKEDDKYSMFPLSPIQFNNNYDASTTTPPRNFRSPYEDDDCSITTRDSDDENSILNFSRKSLFPRLHERTYSPSTFSSDDSPMTDLTKDGLLAKSLGDTGIDFDSNEELDSCSDSPFLSNAIISSTPILRTKQSKRLTKTKLSFDD